MAQSISNALGQNYKKDLFSKPVAPAWKNALKGYTVENKYELKPPQSPAQMPRTTSTSVVPSAGQAPARQQQISNIESQAQNIQGLLNQRKANETAEKTKPLVQTKPVQETTNFQSVIKGLIDASKGSKAQQKYLDELAKTAEGNRAIGQDAAALSKQYGSEISRVGGLGAGAVAGNLSRGTSVVGSGNAAIASQSASARMSALAQGQSAALQGTQQQLTGQGQMASAYGQALTGANVQQQQQQSGLASAAGFIQPSIAGYGQTSFDPLTGQFRGGQGGLDPAIAAQQLAQQVKSGQMTYEQAVSSLGYAGGAGQQFLNNALGGGFNIPQSQATLQGQTGVIGQLPALQAAETAAEGIQNKITSYLAANPQLNTSELAAGNLLQQWIEGKQLADPKYQTLFNYLNEYTNTLAPILGVGGSPTNLKTEIAQSFINAAATGASIAEVLANMQTLSRDKLKDMRSGAMGGGVVSGGTGGGGIFDW